MSEWISVKDKLPQDSVPVLVHYKSTYGSPSGYIVALRCHGYWFFKTYNVNKYEFPIKEIEPTHWMSIPELPQEVE